MFGWILRKKKNKLEILINAESLETRVAVLESGRLEELQVEHPTQERIVGSVFKGRIQNLEHDLQAAFVDIGLKRNAFLHYWDMLPDDAARLDIEEDEEEDEEGSRRRRTPRRKRFTVEDIEKQFPPGSEIVVQVTKGAIGTKGPRVTASLSLAGRYLVLMPGSRLKGVSRKIADERERQRLKKIVGQLPVPPNAGVIVRTVAQGARKAQFVRDLQALLASWEELDKAMRESPAPACLYREPDLVERMMRDWVTDETDAVIVDSREQYERIRQLAGQLSRRARSRTQLYEGDLPILDYYDVERQIEEAFRRKVDLKSGGCIVFDETEALIAIDVNSGRFKGKGSQEEAILAVNTEAVEEVARQLRLRNVGGLVVIDLIDMRSRKHQNAVYRAMKDALARDRARVNVLPISELGIMEMTRQRVAESILSSMMVDCPYCRGRGTVRSPLGMSVAIQRQASALFRKARRGGKQRQLQIVVHPTVLARLRSEDEEILVDLQNEFEGKLSVKSDPARHVEYFEIRDGETGEVLYASRDR